MMRICIPCGYIYQAEEAFELLPETWCCPDCGGSKSSFADNEVSLPQYSKDELLRQDSKKNKTNKT